MTTNAWKCVLEDTGGGKAGGAAKVGCLLSSVSCRSFFFASDDMSLHFSLWSLVRGLSLLANRRPSCLLLPVLSYSLIRLSPWWCCVQGSAGAEGKGNKNVPSPRGSHSASVIGTDIYIFGGYGGYDYCLKELGDMFILDTTTMSWKAAVFKGAPSARSGHASCVYKARICVSGGLSSTGPCDDLYWFDTETDTWKQTTIPYERFLLSFGLCHFALLHVSCLTLSLLSS